MIQTYGLYWNIDHIFWGWPKKLGTLEGCASRAKRAVPVDFRDQRGIYALYADYDLIYIGQTGAGDDRLFKRLRAHKNDHLSERWNRFSWFGTQWVTKDHKLSKDIDKVHPSVVEALNILEAIVIAVSEPRLNLQRGRWSDAKQYFQYIQGQGGEDDVEEE
jgi:hypothetical protein